MLECWSLAPQSRPLFPALEERLRGLLHSGVAEHYIDLNEPYLQMNAEQFSNDAVDYLPSMASPDVMAPKPPATHYVNVGAPDYLKMSPSHNPNINSPLSDDQSGHFQFPVLSSTTNESPNSRNRLRQPEEIPMLKRSNQSISATDSESDSSTPDTATLPARPIGVRPMPRDLKKTENYVNVPSAIGSGSKQYSDKNAVSNPGYVVVINNNETRT